MGRMKLLETIEQAFRHMTAPEPQQLRAAIASLELTPEKVGRYIQEPTFLPYGRTVLYQTDALEVILVHLPPGSRTLIHDHGASIGCAYVLEGELTNAGYRLDSYGYAVECAAAVVGPQQFLYAPEGQVHQMRNESQQRMLSFHVYAPRMNNTQVYRTYEQVLDYVI
jgi:cysteine dioxygenase